MNKDGSLSVLGLMLSRMMESEISLFPHPSIPSIYFEVLNRYALFFEQNPKYAQYALQSFLDTRGLFNPVKSIRLRSNYLFLRFVKNLRSVLGPYVESILSVIQDLLVVKSRKLKNLEELSQSSDFDSQIFLFEVVGYLISIESIGEQRQMELLTVSGIN